MTCERCDDNGEITVTVGDQPDYFGNWDSVEIPCPDCEETDMPDNPDLSPMLGVVPPVLPPEQATEAVIAAANWVDAELERLRTQRATRDHDGMAEIRAMQRKLIEDRAATNARIKELVAEQARLARVLRVLDL